MGEFPDGYPKVERSEGGVEGFDQAQAEAIARLKDPECHTFALFVVTDKKMEAVMSVHAGLSREAIDAFVLNVIYAVEIIGKDEGLGGSE